MSNPMSVERRIFITNRIRTLEGNKEARRIRIQVQEENIETLRTQRNAINNALIETMHDNIASSVSFVSYNDYCGDNREKNAERVEEIRVALRDQRRDHERNRATIDTEITRLENSNSDLRNSNSADLLDITNFKSEWFRAFNMSFPHFWGGV